MVTKLDEYSIVDILSLILAKNHMVTKPCVLLYAYDFCLILAKNHMVTKLLH